MFKSQQINSFQVLETQKKSQKVWEEVVLHFPFEKSEAAEDILQHFFPVCRKR
jgi:hypothetical protein